MALVFKNITYMVGLVEYKVYVDLYCANIGFFFFKLFLNSGFPVARGNDIFSP